MDLIEVQARIRAVNPYYVDMLAWTQENGIIKATPRKPLSDLAHVSISQVFHRLGGRYASADGKAWFELRLEQTAPQGFNTFATTPRQDFARISPASEDSALRQTEAQLTRLVRAAHVCLQEGQFDG